MLLVLNKLVSSLHLQSHRVSLVHARRVMLVGWGGNNGTTLTAGVIANKL
jgi:hypothetical protein